jgi:hypothetical protein
MTVTLTRAELRNDAADRVEVLASRLAAGLDDLGDVVRLTAALVETPQDPRLPRMADVARHRLSEVELVADQLDAALDRTQGETPATIDLTELIRVIGARSIPDGEPALHLELPDRSVWVRRPAAHLERSLWRLLSAAAEDADPVLGGRVRQRDQPRPGAVRRPRHERGGRRQAPGGGDMSTGWFEPLVRGLLALAVTAGLFGAARVRFRRGGDEDAPSDTGLD